MEQAHFFSEIADGPPNGAAYWVRSDDNLRLRVGAWQPTAQSKGTAFLFLGRFGYIERYGRVAKQFAEKGIATIVPDWRSQGLSDRLTDDPKVGHVSNFLDYQSDVRATLEVAETLNLPKPWYLVGISMGACIGLRSILDGLPVSAAAFISPMWGIKLTRMQRAAAWPITWAAQALNLGHRYVPGENSEIYVLTTPYEENCLTHNGDMYQYWVEQAKAAPDLQIGGPSMAWLYQSLLECRRLSQEASPDIPCLTLCGELDELVDNEAIKDRMKRWPNSEFEIIKRAKHDVLTEREEICGDVMARLARFFDSVRPDTNTRDHLCFMNGATASGLVQHRG